MRDNESKEKNNIAKGSKQKQGQGEGARGREKRKMNKEERRGGGKKM